MIKMFHITYKTTNLINYKIYIGVHSTENPEVFDGYLGSGKVLLLAIKKHGKDNFIREILSIYETSEEAFAEERRIVDEEFVARDDTYNLKVGGNGAASGKNHFMFGKHWSDITKKNMSLAQKGKKSYMFGKHLSDETKKKLSESKKGENNSFYGKHHSEETKKKISRFGELSVNIIEQRRKDIEVNYQQYGWKTKLSKKWGINHSGVRYFINKHAFDLVRSS